MDIDGYDLDDEGCDDPDCVECFDDAEPESVPEYVPYVTWRFPKVSKGQELKFMECSTCAAKPGSPILCQGCLNNRTVIDRLLEERRKARELFHITNPDLPNFTENLKHLIENLTPAFQQTHWLVKGVGRFDMSGNFIGQNSEDELNK